MNDRIIVLLGVLLALSCVTAVAREKKETQLAPTPAAESSDPVEQEYQRLLAQDDAAQEEVERWIREHQAFKEKGAGALEASLNLRIDQRFQPVRKAYENFLQRHPRHVRARLAYGSFLGDIGEEPEGVKQWEKARELDPKNPAAWNNLANYYGHRGPVTNAFVYYAKAMELDPKEPVYIQNLATVIYLFRKDAREFFQITEQQVFDRALELYQQALKLDPDNFEYAHDLAQSYIGIRPPRPKEALAAWQYTLKTAKDQKQREGVFLHLARTEMQLGRFAEARQHLDTVTLEIYQVLKERLLRNLKEKEAKTDKNSPSVSTSVETSPKTSLPETPSPQ